MSTEELDDETGTPWEDVFGVPIEAGDTIVYAVRVGNSDELKLGVVLGYVDKLNYDDEVVTKLSVEIDSESWTDDEIVDVKRKVTLTIPERIAVVKKAPKAAGSQPEARGEATDAPEV